VRPKRRADPVDPSTDTRTDAELRAARAALPREVHDEGS
jgi:hypothetical protein